MCPRRARSSRKYVADIELRRDEVESFDRYPFSLAAVRPLDRLEFHPAVTFFVGENGSGKSTLLEAVAVACGFNAEGGSKNFRFATHSPILLAYPESAIFQFSAAGIERIAYEETEHYRITRNFLANPRRMLDILFDREAEAT